MLSWLRSVAFFRCSQGLKRGGEGTRKIRGRNLTVKLVIRFGDKLLNKHGVFNGFQVSRFSIWHNIWWFITPIAFSVLQEVDLNRTANLDGKSWWKEGFERHILQVTIFKTLSEFRDADDKKAAGLSTPTCGIYVGFLVYIYFCCIFCRSLTQRTSWRRVISICLTQSSSAAIWHAPLMML